MKDQKGNIWHVRLVGKKLVAVNTQNQKELGSFNAVGFVDFMENNWHDYVPEMVKYLFKFLPRSVELELRAAMRSKIK